MNRRRLTVGILAALLAAGGWLFVRSNPGLFDTGDGASSQAAFERWLAAEPEGSATFARFERFLQAEGVGDVVPNWQLLRVDATFAARCELGHFAMPPEDLWPRIVPALRLVRDRVEPQVGEIEVLSAFRSPAINDCVNGAGGSKHLAFAALDLATLDRQRNADFFASLCAMQRRAGPASRMGLGAYFDPAKPDRSRGRFHIDGEGFRNWGFDYTSRSSPCPLLLAD